MSNESKARVSWNVEDVHQAAEEMEVVLTDSQAEEILEGCEERLQEAMIGAGWEVLYEAVTDKPDSVTKADEEGDDDA